MMRGKFYAHLFKFSSSLYCPSISFLSCLISSSISSTALSSTSLLYSHLFAIRNIMNGMPIIVMNRSKSQLSISFFFFNNIVCIPVYIYLFITLGTVMSMRFFTLTCIEFITTTFTLSHCIFQFNLPSVTYISPCLSLILYILLLNFLLSHLYISCNLLNKSASATVPLLSATALQHSSN